MSIIPPYTSFYNYAREVPGFYTDQYDMEQRTLEMAKQLFKLICYSNEQTDKINSNTAAIADTNEHLDQALQGFYEQAEPFVKNRVCEWLCENLDCLLANAVKFVTFKLDDNGHFVIDIPKNWQFLNFYTEMNPCDPYFGHLQLSY